MIVGLRLGLSDRITLDSLLIAASRFFILNFIRSVIYLIVFCFFTIIVKKVLDSVRTRRRKRLTALWFIFVPATTNRTDTGETIWRASWNVRSKHLFITIITIKSNFCFCLNHLFANMQRIVKRTKSRVRSVAVCRCATTNVRSWWIWMTAKIRVDPNTVMTVALRVCWSNWTGYA